MRLLVPQDGRRGVHKTVIPKPSPGHNIPTVPGTAKMFYARMPQSPIWQSWVSPLEPVFDFQAGPNLLMASYLATREFASWLRFTIWQGLQADVCKTETTVGGDI